MSTTSPPPAEDGVLHYSWIDPVDFGATAMAINTKLSRALDAMSCIPSMQFPFDLGSGEGSVFTIGEVPAGDMGHPNVDVILQKSTLSAFG